MKDNNGDLVSIGEIPDKAWHGAVSTHHFYHDEPSLGARIDRLRVNGYRCVKVEIREVEEYERGY